MNKLASASVCLAFAVGVGGCAETPAGPHVQVLPGANKPFDAFMQDQMVCKQYASDQVTGQAQNANENALIDTLIGAALGAGIGGATHGGHGAGVGAAVGGAAGAAVGGISSDKSGLSIQQQYDNAYSQCMYAKGNQIVSQPATIHVVHPAPTYYYAPPPVIYSSPPVIYSQPQQAPAQQHQGYAPPSGAAIPPPNTAAPPPAK